MDGTIEEPGTISSYIELDEKTWEWIKVQFALYDKDKSDSIPIEDLGNALRVCGQTPFESEVEDLKQIADPTESGIVKWDDFKAVLEECTTLYQRGSEDLQAALLSFLSEPRALIQLDTLRFMLTTRGDKLSDEEMNEFFEELKSETDSDHTVPVISIVERLLPDYLTKDLV